MLFKLRKKVDTMSGQIEVKKVRFMASTLNINAQS